MLLGLYARRRRTFNGRREELRRLLLSIAETRAVALLRVWGTRRTAVGEPSCRAGPAARCWTSPTRRRRRLRRSLLECALQRPLVNTTVTDMDTDAKQIARHSAIFCVTEIVVYRDAASAQTAPAGGHKPRGKYRDTDAGASGGGKDEEDPSTFLGRILEYLETPQ